MEIPIWVAAILLTTIISLASYLIKLILDHEKRITHIEEHLNGKGNP